MTIVVVDVAPGVAGHPALPWLDGRRLGCAIRQREHEDAAHAFEDVSRVGVGFAAVGEVVHVAGVAAGEPLVEPLGAGRGDGGADAGEGESQAGGAIFQ